VVGAGGFSAFAIGLSIMAISILTQLFFFRRRGWL
jgi:hypothetical protein